MCSSDLTQGMITEFGGQALSYALQNQPELTNTLLMTSYGAGVNVGVMLPFSRMHEREADRIGLTLMAIAGYDPRASIGFWERMDAMSKARVPAVVAPGCLDMVNYGERDSVPPGMEGRNFYIHNPQVTLMRTNAEECAQLGKIIAEKANANPAPVSILVPTKAISIISAEGQPFHDPAADAALFSTIRENAKVEVCELEFEINSADFAKACADKLLGLIESANSPA